MALHANWKMYQCERQTAVSVESESSLEVERTCFGQLVIWSANFVNSDTSAGFFVISLLFESLAVPFWSVWSIYCQNRVLIRFFVILFSYSFALLCIGWSPFCAVGAVMLTVNSHFFHVHRMAQNEPKHTLPVFVQNNSLPAFDKKDFSTAEICSYAEKNNRVQLDNRSPKNQRSLENLPPR